MRSVDNEPVSRFVVHVTNQMGRVTQRALSKIEGGARLCRLACTHATR